MAASRRGAPATLSSASHMPAAPPAFASDQSMRSTWRGLARDQIASRAEAAQAGQLRARGQALIAVAEAQPLAFTVNGADLIRGGRRGLPHLQVFVESHRRPLTHFCSSPPGLPA